MSRGKAESSMVWGGSNCVLPHYYSPQLLHMKSEHAHVPAILSALWGSLRSFLLRGSWEEERGGGGEDHCAMSS